MLILGCIKKLGQQGGMKVSEVLEVNDSDFEDEIIKSDLPAMIDFWAPWCGPCHMVSPLVEELAREYDGRFKVCKMNVDGNTVTPGRFGIRSIPTILIFKDGELSDTIVGAVGKANIEKAMTKVI